MDNNYIYTNQIFENRQSGLNILQGDANIMDLMNDNLFLALIEGRIHGTELSEKISSFSVNEDNQRTIQDSSAVVETEDGKAIGMISSWRSFKDGIIILITPSRK